MSPRLPPRREPRVLAVTRSQAGFSHATVDPWEVRSAGKVSCRDGTLGLSLLKIARREKPTLLFADDAMKNTMARVALVLGVAVVTQALPKMPLKIACDLYPELPMRAPTLGLAQAAALAIAAVLYADAPVPSRHYATHRNPNVRATARRDKPHERAA